MHNFPTEVVFCCCELLQESTEPAICHWTDEALRNPLILHTIFKYFPTKFLHHKASRVNKTWNWQARIFIRDHREYRPDGSYINPCKLLAEYIPMCANLKQNGRKIPWNSLQLDLTGCKKGKCAERFQDGKCFDELGDEMKIKHLKIIWYKKGTKCRVWKELLTFLLHQKSGDLLTLKFNNLVVLRELFRPDWRPHLPKLEEISISDEPSEYHLPICREVMKVVLDGSPNFSRISVKFSKLKVLQIFPEEKYRVLEKLELSFWGLDKVDEILLCKVVDSKPPVKEMTVRPPTWSGSGFASNEQDVEEQEKFYKWLQLLLEGCHESLRMLSFQNPCPPPYKLAFSPLVNLTKLELCSCFRYAANFWEFICSIDYNQLMPNVNEVHVDLSSSPWNRYCHDKYPEMNEWPRQSDDSDEGSVTRYCNVRRLQLDLRVKIINLALLKAVFPNVSILQLRLYNTSKYDGEEEIPISKIVELWPALETLEISGNGNTLRRSYDADICGINAEEVELLWEKDEEYLKAVHIVPIRPSLLTMTSM